MDGEMTRQATPDQHIQSRLSTLPFSKLARRLAAGRNYLCGGDRAERECAHSVGTRPAACGIVYARACLHIHKHVPGGKKD